MNIAIIGYGKMGHAIEQIAQQRGHTIVAVIDAHNRHQIHTPEFRSAQVAIEFTAPDAALANCLEALDEGVKVVSGSTGWTTALPRIQERTVAIGGTFLWSSNYSIGVNLFFEINRQVAQLLSRFPQYTPVIDEVHHIHKLDHPSGTAVSLASDIIQCSPSLNRWSETPAGDDTLLVNHTRRAETPGTHSIHWDSPTDTITLTHTAHSRHGFAQGAVIAAEWVATQRGFLTMQQFMHHLTKQ